MSWQLLQAAGFTFMNEPGGVYVLFLDGAVVYVGQSGNVGGRIRNHELDGLGFDAIMWLPLPPEERTAYEGALTRRLNPTYAVRCNRDESRDEEILIKLGLGFDPGARLAALERLRRAEAKVTEVRVERKRAAS